MVMCKACALHKQFAPHTACPSPTCTHVYTHAHARPFFRLYLLRVSRLSEALNGSPYTGILLSHAGLYSFQCTTHIDGQNRSHATVPMLVALNGRTSCGRVYALIALLDQGCSSLFSCQGALRSQAHGHGITKTEVRQIKSLLQTY